MEAIRLENVVKAVEGQVLSGNCNNKQILSVAKDSRDSLEQGLFVAIKGENTNGHEYIKDAAKNGAIAVIIDENINEYVDGLVYIKVENTIKALQQLATWYREQFNIPFVAVTGSVGKTTTKDMIASVLETKYKVLKTQGNLNSEIGAPLTLLNLNAEHEVAVIEMGMDHLGQIARISKMVKPNAAVITNVGVAHIEYLKTRENILKAKCEVLENLTKDGTAILNIDDDMLTKVKDNVKKIWFGKNEKADIRVDNLVIDYTDGVVKADMYIYDQRYDLVIPGLSEHLVYSAMSAVAVGIRYNIPIEKILGGIKNYTHTKMRMDIYKLQNNILVIDDTYNANPDSMKSLINTLAKADKANKILIAGDMFELGEDSLKLHQEVLSYAINCGINKIVVTGEIMNKAAKSLEYQNIISFKDKEELINNLEKIIEEKSIIGIKASRGMKFENITEKILEKYVVL